MFKDASFLNGDSADFDLDMIFSHAETFGMKDEDLFSESIFSNNDAFSFHVKTGTNSSSVPSSMTSNTHSNTYPNSAPRFSYSFPPTSAYGFDGIDFNSNIDNDNSAMTSKVTSPGIESDITIKNINNITPDPSPNHSTNCLINSIEESFNDAMFDPTSPINQSLYFTDNNSDTEENNRKKDNHSQSNSRRNSIVTKDSVNSSPMNCFNLTPNNICLSPSINSSESLPANLTSNLAPNLSPGIVSNFNSNFKPHLNSSIEIPRKCEKLASLKNTRGKKQLWTKDEDERLMQAISEYGVGEWMKVAESIGNGRTRAQCSQRWSRVLNPGLRRKPWSQQEDAMLIAAVSANGIHKWTKVADAIPGRCDVQCRYRYIQLSKSDIC
ncbi:hypothetical protein TRFO_40311 [Tritrichomonas foetus]|uniref:Myb-like DNA-binding domain containing protein n=1 Tax=Tritrichomonas foetus TaxID=1144522 RepID=A0A1J4J1A4_9EUKA|nr:hypothetical protein TRFO_40311 [Tritrichomonas foetus]|eukprot:OHS93374.1 hypothetical protein TRFO_40311 [Tritrichomonas foetus]